MPVLISIFDDCKPLADAIHHLLASVERAQRRADGGRAVDYAQVERELGERAAAVERAAHQRLLAGLDRPTSSGYRALGAVTKREPLRDRGGERPGTHDGWFRPSRSPASPLRRPGRA